MIGTRSASEAQGHALIDAAFDVCTALSTAGATAVLTGGSAATYYAPAAYQSVDIDFVLTVASPDGSESDALAEIGYQLQGNLYRHPERLFPVEFPPRARSLTTRLIESSTDAS